MGQHAGIHRYTIGQRRGIGIAGEQPLYVINIDAAKNRIMVGQQEELLSSEFTAAGVNWIAFDPPDEPVRAEVRVRYRHTPAPATITPIENNRVRIVFDEPQRAITPGQATVFYRGDEVVGGGWIVKNQWAVGSGQWAVIGSSTHVCSAHCTLPTAHFLKPFPVPSTYSQSE